MTVPTLPRRPRRAGAVGAEARTRAATASPRRATRPPRRAASAARLAAGLLSGVLLMLAFPPVGWWPLSPVAIAVLAAALRGAGARRGAAVGLLHGLGFFVPLLHWSGIYVGAVPWLLLAGSQAAYLAGLGALAPTLLARRAGPAWFALLWVAQEAVRSRAPFGGFPWGRLAFGVDGSPLSRFAPLAGAPGVSFVVALAGALLAATAVAGVAAWRVRTGPGTVAGFAGTPPARLVLGLLAVATLVFGGLVVPVAPGTAGGGSTVVAVVQGNVPRLGLDFNAQREAVLRNHVALTHQLAARVRAGSVPRPDVVIWPENASDVDPFRDPAAAALISQAVDDVGVPVLVGAVVRADNGKLENTSVVWSPGAGPGQRYIKRHPVPFAEYVPFRSLARLVSDKVDLVTDFEAGRLPPVLHSPAAQVGAVICFEVAYDNLVHDGVRDGAGLIAVQTNNATFGRSGESAQQLAMTRLRAMETGRTAVQASTSGESAVITPAGRVLGKTGIFQPGLLVDQVPLRTGLTPAVRVGAWPELVAALAVLAGLLVSRRTFGANRPRRSTKGELAT